jgi:allantoin racemase
VRIKVINPNTTASMTAKIAAAARAIALPSTEIIAASGTTGPASIEGNYDEAVATVGLLEEVRRGEAQGCDGYVIACFGDPGLLAAREIASGPVLGIAEAAFHAASMVATGFSVVTTLGRSTVICEHLLHRYGFERICRRVRATDLPVLELENPRSDSRRIITEECRRALAEDRAGAIVLGCAGMADLARDLSDELGVPVIDGVAVAVTMVEGLVRLGLKTAKNFDLAYPITGKSWTGRLADMAP